MANPTKVITGKSRFCFVNVFQPKSIDEGGTPKYSICILVNKKDVDTVKDIEAAIDAAWEAGKAKFGKAFANKNKLKLPLRDGDDERSEDPTYQGHWFLNANCAADRPPTVVARDGKTLITSSNEFYSGVFGRASINFYPFSVSGNSGIAVGLNNLMKIADGDRLSGGASAQADFAEYSEGDDLGAELEGEDIF